MLNNDIHGCLLWLWQVHRRLYAPRPCLLHEPVHEPASVVDNLAVDPDLRVLHAGDERTGRYEINIKLFERHGEYLARHLFDPAKECFCIDNSAAMRAVDEANGEAFCYGAQITAANGGRELL